MSVIKLKDPQYLNVIDYLEKNSKDMERVNGEIIYYISGRRIKFRKNDKTLTADNMSQDELERLRESVPEERINHSVIESILKTFFGIIKIKPKKKKCKKGE